MGRKLKKDITIVLHVPDDAQSTAKFEMKICSFYIAQIEKRLRPLEKAQRLAALRKLIEGYRKSVEQVSS